MRHLPKVIIVFVVSAIVGYAIMAAVDGNAVDMFYLKDARPLEERIKTLERKVATLEQEIADKPWLLLKQDQLATRYLYTTPQGNRITVHPN